MKIHNNANIMEYLITFHNSTLTELIWERLYKIPKLDDSSSSTCHPESHNVKSLSKYNTNPSFHLHSGGREWLLLTPVWLADSLSLHVYTAVFYALVIFIWSLLLHSLCQIINIIFREAKCSPILSLCSKFHPWHVHIGEFHLEIIGTPIATIVPFPYD